MVTYRVDSVDIAEVEANTAAVELEGAVANKLYRSSRKIKPYTTVRKSEENTELVARNRRGQDPKVAKTEDALHPAATKSLDLASLQLTNNIPNRPGYGTRGAKVELTANYVELLPPSNMTLHRYDVQLSPAATGRKCFRVFQLLLQSADMAPYRDGLATDFRSTLVSKAKFPRNETIIEEIGRAHV